MKCNANCGGSIVAGLFLLVLFLSACQRKSLTVPQKVVLSDWHFQVDVFDIGEKEEWYREGYDRSRWAKVKVPAAWDTYDPALWGYEGVGWYATVIPAGQLPRGEHVFIRFGRVNYQCRLWINGKPAGGHTGGYLPFEREITTLLDTAGENMLVIRVDNQPREEWLPASRQIEWPQYGGILQPVEMIGRGTLYLGDISVYARPHDGGKVADITVDIHDLSSQTHTVVLYVKVTVAGRQINKSIEVTTVPFRVKTVTVQLSLKKAQCWSPQLPRLYPLQVSLTAGSSLLDRKEQTFGIREIRTEGHRILLNGKPLYIKGFNWYDLRGRQGPELREEALRSELLRIRATGANTVRVHYPPTPLTLRLMDETGLLLVEELPLNWWGQNWWGLDTVRQDTAILKEARQTLREMIGRDRNHPCILAWSLANECRTDNKTGDYVIRQLIRLAHRLDTTRPVTFTVNNETGKHRAFEEADIVSCNIYFGNDKAFHAGMMDTLTKMPAEVFLRRQCAVWPEKPLMVTEFGAAGIHGLHGDVPFTEEHQADYIEKMWNAIQNVPACTGAILWCWKDYYHRKYFTQTYAPFGPYGVVNTGGKEKLSLGVMKRLFAGDTPRPEEKAVFNH